MDNPELFSAVSRLALSESGFVFDPMSGQSFTVNPIGLAILREMQRVNNSHSILQFALENYDGDKQEIERDVDDFLANLGEQLGIQ